jgi:hypothetical protein
MQCLALPLVVVLASLSGASCARDEAPHSPAHLVGPLFSGMSRDEVRELKEVQGGAWSISTAETHKLPSGSEARFVEINVARFSSFGVQGRALLWFFDDLLARVYFYPEDLASYAKRYREETGMDLLKPRAGHEIGGVWIWAWSESEETNHFVGWRDMHLADRFDNYN